MVHSLSSFTRVRHCERLLSSPKATNFACRRWLELAKLSSGFRAVFRLLSTTLRIHSEVIRLFSDVYLAEGVGFESGEKTARIFGRFYTIG